MKYMLLIYEAEGEYREPSTMQAVVQAHMKLAAELREKGILISGDGLQTSETATTVKFAADGQTLHDGPFPETREQLGGYYLIEAKDLDEALAWARRVPCSAGGGVEVRPLMVY